MNAGASQPETTQVVNAVVSVNAYAGQYDFFGTSKLVKALLTKDTSEQQRALKALASGPHHE